VLGIRCLGRDISLSLRRRPHHRHDQAVAALTLAFQNRMMTAGMTGTGVLYLCCLYSC
jgi:hypothetical protein